MNERIKELAEQAGLWKMLQDFSDEFGNCDVERDCSAELEKFAELIVKECSDVIMTKDRYRREYFASVINDHFKSD